MLVMVWTRQFSSQDQRSTGPAESAAREDLGVPDGGVVEVERGRAPEMTPARGEEAGSRGFFGRQVTDNDGKEAVREFADAVCRDDGPRIRPSLLRHDLLLLRHAA